MQTRSAKVALRFPRGDGSGRIVVGLSTDASFDRQPRGGSQQGIVLFIGDRRLVFDKRAPVSMVGWQSNRIRRVVKSTLAAEACALSSGYDQAIFLRVLLSRLLGVGYPDRPWHDEALDIPQVTWSDCNSLIEMLAREGAMSTERRIALDVYDVQQYAEDDDVLWCPTGRQIADCLTKHFSPTDANPLQPMMDSGYFQAQPDG